MNGRPMQPQALPAVQASVASAVQLDNPEETAQGTVPYWADDSNKTKYLSFRATGFSVEESRVLTGVTNRTISRWRDSDEDFHRLDGPDIGDLRRTMAGDFLGAEFTKNMRLFMARDYAVIRKAFQGEELTMEEAHYLRVIRPMYSASQLHSMVDVVNRWVGNNESFDFKALVIHEHTSEARRANGAKAQVLEYEGKQVRQEEERPAG